MGTRSACGPRVGREAWAIPARVSTRRFGHPHPRCLSRHSPSRDWLLGPTWAGSGVAIGHCLHVRSPQSLTLSRTRPNTVGAQLKMSGNVVNQELQPTTSFLRAPVILLDKLPFTLRIGRSQLLYFLLGALSDVIAALFTVHSIVRKQLHSSLCTL